MGYTITYPSSKKAEKRKKHHRRGAVFTCGCLFAFFLAVCLFCPQLLHDVQSFLIPGDAAVTVAAMEEFSSSLKSGTSLLDGFTLFCLRILEGAEHAAY